MGEQKPNPDYGEILRLEKMLTDAGIGHRMERMADGWRLEYPAPPGKRVCTAVEYTGSYGASIDRLELIGLLNHDERKGKNSMVGWLTAENVFDRIRRDWERRKKRREKMES